MYRVHEDDEVKMEIKINLKLSRPPGRNKKEKKQAPLLLAWLDSSSE
jgi:hypothetical protein